MTLELSLPRLTPSRAQFRNELVIATTTNDASFIVVAFPCLLYRPIIELWDARCRHDRVSNELRNCWLLVCSLCWSDAHTSMRNTWPQKRATSTFNDNSGKFRHILVIISLLHSAVYYGRRLKLPPQITIITINVVHEVQNKYKHKRKAKKATK